jgi:D-glycero-D-manno-heptose 1,7-bisphosphate phosphatase
MPRPAIFFDRDNTLIVSDGYLADPNSVILMDGAAEAVAKARMLGFKIVTISNQSGVAKGLFDEAVVQAVNLKLDQLLTRANPAAVIDRHEYCPFHPEATVEAYRQDSDLRKPKPGMLLAAAAALDLDLKNSWVIGDSPRDVAAGQAAGCRAILFKPPGLPPSPAAAEPMGAPPDFVAQNLPDAIAKIAAELAPAARAAPAPPAWETRLENLQKLSEQILYELRHLHDHSHADFSTAKLLAGVVQALALATLFISLYLFHGEPILLPALLMGVFLQLLTIALLLIGRD